MLRKESKSDEMGFFLPLVAVLVIFLATIVYTNLVIFPDKLGFAMIIAGLVIVYAGLSRLLKKLDMMETRKK